MVRLAQKAFFPGKIPFPLLHIDTTYKFREMIEFRDDFTKIDRREADCPYQPAGHRRRGQSVPLGTQKCCGLLKTRALLDALAEGGYDAAFGGARREEEKSRAKERVYSFRDEFGQWDPKNQRPELWNVYQLAHRQGRDHPRFPAFQLDRSSTSGSTSSRRIFPSCRCISRSSAPWWCAGVR